VLTKHAAICGETKHERRVQVVRLRKRHLLLVALSGAAVAVVPTIASSATTATVEALNEGGGVYGERHFWSPAEAAVMPADAVQFVNKSATVNHGIIWTSSAKPSCASGVPVGVGKFATNWSGSCTFTQAGEYTFYCSFHGPSMHGTIYVNTAGTVPTTTTTTTSTSSTSTTFTYTTTTATTTPTTTTTTQTQPPPSTTTSTQPPGGTTATTANTTTPAGEAPEGALPPVLALAGSQRGGALRGSASIPPADNGARLEVDLLATTASLARKHAKQVRVGRFLRASVAAGKISFSVSLDAQARRALRRHHRLALIVLVTLTPPRGAPVTTTRSVVLHG
jgi:plastocyanin